MTIATEMDEVAKNYSISMKPSVKRELRQAARLVGESESRIIREALKLYYRENRVDVSAPDQIERAS